MEGSFLGSGSFDILLGGCGVFLFEWIGLVFVCFRGGDCFRVLVFGKSLRGGIR